MQACLLIDLLRYDFWMLCFDISFVRMFDSVDFVEAETAVTQRVSWVQ